jgi:hypothetical protein
MLFSTALKENSPEALEAAVLETIGKADLADAGSMAESVAKEAGRRGDLRS